MAGGSTPFKNPDEPTPLRVIMRQVDPVVLVTEAFLPKSKVFRLYCDCTKFKRKRCCTHIMEAVLGRFDVMGEEYGEPYALPSGPPESIEVPIFFRPQILAIRVHLETPIEPTNFRRISLDREPFDLGFVPMFASRKEIRMAFLEWLHGDWDLRHNEMRCDAPMHNPGSAPHETWETLMTKEGRPSNTLLVDYWTLVTEGMCMTCHADNGVPDI